MWFDLTYVSIYRAFLPSPKMHGESRFYCIYVMNFKPVQQWTRYNCSLNSFGKIAKLGVTVQQPFQSFFSAIIVWNNADENWSEQAPSEKPRRLGCKENTSRGSDSCESRFHLFKLRRAWESLITWLGLDSFMFWNSTLSCHHLDWVRFFIQTLLLWKIRVGFRMNFPFRWINGSPVRSGTLEDDTRGLL
jgi:hypothetical protein